MHFMMKIIDCFCAFVQNPIGAARWRIPFAFLSEEGGIAEGDDVFGVEVQCAADVENPLALVDRTGDDFQIKRRSLNHRKFFRQKGGDLLLDLLQPLRKNRHQNLHRRKGKKLRQILHLRVDILDAIKLLDQEK